MNPTISIQWVAVLVAVVASFFFSFLWWGPLFGKMWAKGIGMNTDVKPEFSSMIRPMLLNLAGSFLTAYVLVFSTNVWRGSVWGSATADMADWKYGFYSGIFTWIGFYIPLLLNQVAWEQRPWSVFAINSGGHLIALQIMAHILACWRA